MSLRRDVLWYTNVRLSVRPFHMSRSNLRTPSRADPGFQVRGGGGGAHLKKLRRAEGGANIFGVFRVKNHDFTPKNHFSNFRGGAQNFWGISCEKSRFYAKKNHIFTNFRGGTCRVRPPLNLSLPLTNSLQISQSYWN